MLLAVIALGFLLLTLFVFYAYLLRNFRPRNSFSYYPTNSFDGHLSLYHLRLRRLYYNPSAKRGAKVDHDMKTTCLL